MLEVGRQRREPVRLTVQVDDDQLLVSDDFDDHASGVEVGHPNSVTPLEPQSVVVHTVLVPDIGGRGCSVPAQIAIEPYLVRNRHRGGHAHND